MFSPPQLTVVRCKPECQKTLIDEINSKLENEYSKRFLDVPEILSTDSDNIICFKNRIDKDVSPKRHPCDIRNYEEQIVIIDSNCGAAVLRGADIFAPGVVTCTETFVDDIVGIWCDTANERRARESKTGSKFILKGARFPIGETHKEHLIFLGLGRVLIDRASLFCEKPVESGVAVQLYRPVIDSPPFSDNFIYNLSNYGYLQNHGSIRICDLLLNGNNIQNNLKLIDMCAAPGGKTTYLMQALEGKYEKFVAVDRKTRVVSLEKQLERYSQDHSIQVINGDSTKLDFDNDTFDLILLDAPCSATGSRPKPKNELISDRQTKSYQKLQRKLLIEGIRILKPGGIIVYSTCSVLNAENEENVLFMNEKFDGKIIHETSIGYNPFGREMVELPELPGINLIQNEDLLEDTIGFFAARFRKL